MTLPFQVPDVIVPTVAKDASVVRDVADVSEFNVVTALVAKPPEVFTALPIAVKTPVPVVVVAGVAPAPPPITMAFAAKTAEEAQVDAELK
jgi:hypothetical protein